MCVEYATDICVTSICGFGLGCLPRRLKVAEAMVWELQICDEQTLWVPRKETV